MAYDDWFSLQDNYERPYGSYRGAPRNDPRARAYPRDYWQRPGGQLDRPERYESAGPWRERSEPLRERGGMGGDELRRWRRAARRGPSYGAEYFGSRSSRERPGPSRQREVPPDYRRYLSREEYGLNEGWESSQVERPPRGPQRGRRSRGPERFNEGVLGPRNALFGGEGFRRYDSDYEQWW